VIKDAAEVHALRARACQAVSAAFARQDEADAAWVAADRAISAELAGGRTSVIAGHLRLAHAFVRLGRYDQAEHVTTVALAALKPRAKADDTTVEELSLYGAMNLVQAARAGGRAAMRGPLEGAGTGPLGVERSPGRDRRRLTRRGHPGKTGSHPFAASVPTPSEAPSLSLRGSIGNVHISSLMFDGSWWP
jgi:hypothetical protein